MKKDFQHLIIIIAFAAVFLYLVMSQNKRSIPEYDQLERTAKISPDYTSAVIPPNIAPLNFMIDEEGVEYGVKIYSDNGTSIEIFSNCSGIRIPAGKWHRLLDMNKGNDLYFDIYVKNHQRWIRFKSITNRIAREKIDDYLVYRKMLPAYYQVLHEKMDICIRNITNYKESAVLKNYQLKGGCINCHAFCRNQPENMLLGIRRSPKYGVSTLLVNNDKVLCLDMKIGYTSWHPSGKVAAFSVNDIPMYFHTKRREPRNTMDLKSMIAYYRLGSRTVKSVPALSDKGQLENWPCFSVDGKRLFFCNSKKLWGEDADMNNMPFEFYDQVKYDLMSINYDITKDKWGDKAETIVSSGKTGQTIAAPQVSPDGRWLSFCMFDYGFFPTWQEESDIYMIDLQEAEKNGTYNYRRLELNSDRSDSWHKWSSNSRWIVFSSKRDYDPFTKPYFSYIDENGKSYKPVVLPQKDPDLYNCFLYSFNTPELITSPVKLTGEKLARVIRKNKKIFVGLPKTMASPKAQENTEYGGVPYKSQN